MMKYLLAVGLFFFSFVSFGEPFVVGKDYELVKSDETLKSTHGPVQVTEFFSFGCHWCYQLETPLNQWLNQKGTAVQLTKIPVVFNKDWEYCAKAYYTAQALSLSKTLNPLLFKTILIDKKSLNSNQTMISFFRQNGADPSTVESAFLHSPSIHLKISESQGLMAHYHIAAVPAFIVNKQFKTDLQMAKTNDRLLQILDFLIEKASKKG